MGIGADRVGTEMQRERMNLEGIGSSSVTATGSAPMSAPQKDEENDENHPEDNGQCGEKS